VTWDDSPHSLCVVALLAVLNCAALRRAVLCYAALCSCDPVLLSSCAPVLLCCAVLCCACGPALPCPAPCAMLHCAVLHCFVPVLCPCLCCASLCCAVLFCAVLCCAVLVLVLCRTGRGWHDLCRSASQAQSLVTRLQRTYHCNELAYCSFVRNNGWYV
jgi:hypothetical protein